jgi:hypothetical protein
MKQRIGRLIATIATIVVAVCLGVPLTAAAAQGTWYAEYFPNRDLAGGPAITRYEEKLRFEWGGGGPGGGVPSDDFSARWTRDEWFENGTYRFSYRADDGIRIWVGDTLVVDDWRESPAAWVSIERTIARGTHRVRVEYFERGGTAVLEAGWVPVSGGTSWRAEYFSNRKLSGGPALVRYDPAVDFDWRLGSPDAAIPADEFSVRWTRVLGFTPGTYRFYASCDDGVRIFVDGRLVVDAWRDQKLPNTRAGDIALGAGQHTVVVEYYEHADQASAHVWWDLIGSFAGWQGRYYDNAQLRGGPALVRDDAAISFDWGESAPADWMPSDRFSAVWTRRINFAAGYYRFNVQSDDGVRFWLDNALVMDYWQPQDYVLRYVDGTFLEGPHDLKVEYFEQTGTARIRFWWEPSGTGTASTPPVSATPAPTPPAPMMPGPWQGEYFNNRSLAGTPVLRRADTALDFTWGWGSPAPEVSRDDFSARWTGSFPFEQGRYTFSSYSDDGVRVLVDGRPVISAWRPMRGNRSGSAVLAAGTHAVQVEFFDRSGVANLRVFWRKTGDVAVVPALPPAAGSPTTAAARPTQCTGGPLRLEAWPVGTACAGAGWTATVFVQAEGGDCRYTYAWEGTTRAGPVPGSATFQLGNTTRGSAMVGTVSVSSGGQTAKTGLYISPPASCK